MRRTSGVSNAAHVRELASVSPGTLSEVVLCGVSLASQGILRFALKYALWSAKKAGSIRISLGSDKRFGFRPGAIAAWQVRNEIFRIVYSHTPKIATIDLHNDSLIIATGEPWAPPKSVGLCFIWSGNNSEIPHLRRAVEAACISARQSPIPCRVIVGGRAGIAAPILHTPNADYNFEYVPLIDAETGGRLLTAKKKNELLQAVDVDVAAVCHARIELPPTIGHTLYARPLDAATSRISAVRGGRLSPYLDYLLLESYQIAHPTRTPARSSEDFGDHLTAMRGKVPYADGGMLLVDLRSVGTSPFADIFAWGEAEDVETAHALWDRGFLLDYWADVGSISQSAKYGVSAWHRRLIRQLRFSLGMMGPYISRQRER